MAQHPLAQYLDAVPDFPKPGILFSDISPLLKNHFVETIDAMSDLYTEEEWNNIDSLSAIESRGFIFAAALAFKHNKGFIKDKAENRNLGTRESFSDISATIQELFDIKNSKKSSVFKNGEGGRFYCIFTSLDNEVKGILLNPILLISFSNNLIFSSLSSIVS